MVTACAAPTACKHQVSGSISLLLQSCFSPFPHGTSSLSVVGSYLALEDGSPCFLRDSTCPAVLRYQLCCSTFQVQGFHLLWQSFPASFPCALQSFMLALQPHMDESIWFRLFPLRSPLLRESRLISLPSGTEMFHFPEFASRDYVFIS